MKKVFSILLVTLFIYNPKFVFLPIGLGKLVYFGVLIYGCFHIKHFLSMLRSKWIMRTIVLLAIIAVLYTVRALQYGNRDGEISYFSSLFITEYIIGGYLLYNLLNKKFAFDELKILEIIRDALLLQSCAIVLSFVLPSFKGALDVMLPYNGNLNEDSFRMRGFFNTSGAGLSVTQSIATMLTCVLMYINKKSTVRNFFILLIIFLSIVFSGRTGMLLSLVYIFLYLGAEFRLSRFLTGRGRILTSLALFVALLIAGGSLLLNMLPAKQARMVDEKIMPWAFEMYYNYERTGSASSESGEILKNMYVWPTELSTWLLGEGGWHNPRNLKVNYTGSDVGFIRNVYAVGIIGTILFYSIFISMILRAYNAPASGTDNFLKYFFILMLLLHFVIESKEPFFWAGVISKPIVLIFYTTMSYLYSKYIKNRKIICVELPVP